MIWALLFVIAILGFLVIGLKSHIADLNRCWPERDLRVLPRTCHLTLGDQRIDVLIDGVVRFRWDSFSGLYSTCSGEGCLLSSEQHKLAQECVDFWAKEVLK